MTVFNPASHFDLFATDTTSAERLWSADKLAAVLKAAGLYDVVIQTATPAVGDQGKIWFQPDAGNAAPGAFKKWNGTTWAAMTPAEFKAFAAESYTESATAPASPNVGDWWKNTSTATVSDVPAGATSFWTGTAWYSTISAPATFTNTTATGTITPDHSANDVFELTLTGNITVAAPSAVRVGRTLTFRLTQDGTGSRIATWNAVYKWGTAGAPTLSTAAGKIDYVIGYVKSATQIDMAPILKGYP